ncbi:MAG: hypothetical protein Q9184_001218 [Pyrenodesmia sp. 2 TL-2023]
MADNTDAKLRLLTYTRLELERCCIGPAVLERHCPLDDSRHEISLEASAGLNKLHQQTALGALEVLPLEVLQEVLDNLDLQSLTDFRSVSKRARYLVSCIPRYHTIIRHVPYALRFMLSTKTAFHWTLSQLYEALTSRKCFLCGNFGGFLSVLNCRRCCFRCITYSKELFPLTANGVQTQYMLDKTTLAALPVALSLPGRYGLHQKLSSKRNRLILEASARQAAIISHGSETAMMTHISCEIAKRAKRAAGNKRAASKKSTSTSTPQSTVPAEGYHTTSNTAIRCQAVLRFPTLEVSAGNLEWGVACQGCHGRHDHHLAGNDTYNLLTNDQFLQHFDQCEVAQKKWQDYLISGGEMEEHFWPGTKKRCDTIVRPK